MLYDILKMYPVLGSFFYGHWEDFSINSAEFVALMLVLIGIVLLISLVGVIGYVLQSVALAKISRQQGAWRNIRIMASLPFFRYFALGKMAERSDALLFDAQDTDRKRRLWGRILLIVCCIAIPLLLLAATLAIIGLPVMQLFVMIVESAGEMTRNMEGFATVLYLLVVVIALPALLLRMILEDLFYWLFIVMPLVGIVCLLVAALLLALIRTLSGICCYKVLRLYYEQKTAQILSVVGAVTGLLPIVLFAASLKGRGR